MNTIEKALMHGLFVHLHHNINKVIDFKGFQELNRQVDKIWPGALAIGPEQNDDAAVIGEVTSDEKEVFEYNGEVAAVIPNKPSKETLQALRSGK